MRAALGVLVCLCGFAAAHGQTVVKVGPFKGTYFEGFNRFFNNEFFTCIPDRVLEGNADLCTPGNQGAHTTQGWGFKCMVRPFEGKGFYGSLRGRSEFTFDTPVVRFGAYFATNTGVDGMTVVLFDASGRELLREAVALPADCNWHWYGYAVLSESKIKRVQVIGNFRHEGLVMIDAVQADFLYEPCYPDCDQNGVLDIRDVFCFTNRWNSREPYADCDRNAVVDLRDVFCFQERFAAGCR